MKKNIDQQKMITNFFARMVDAFSLKIPENLVLDFEMLYQKFLASKLRKPQVVPSNQNSASNALDKLKRALGAYDDEFKFNKFSPDEEDELGTF